MTLGEPTPYKQLCLAIDSMVAEGKTREEIDAGVEQYYSRLQCAALEQHLTVLELCIKYHPTTEI